MYSHTAICDRCGREFIVEVPVGEPVNRGGRCKACNRRITWIAFAVAIPIVVVLGLIVGVCG